MSTMIGTMERVVVLLLAISVTVTLLGAAIAVLMDNLLLLSIGLACMALTAIVAAWSFAWSLFRG